MQTEPTRCHTSVSLSSMRDNLLPMYMYTYVRSPKCVSEEAGTEPGLFRDPENLLEDAPAGERLQSFFVLRRDRWPDPPRRLAYRAFCTSLRLHGGQGRATTGSSGFGTTRRPRRRLGLPDRAVDAGCPPGAGSSPGVHVFMHAHARPIPDVRVGVDCCDFASRQLLANLTLW